ncbi:MAG: galactokinase [Lewinellaceae bacterium]|nr:galactokinase [Lewinellaceae bacterium]
MLQRNKDSIKNTFNRIFGSEEFYCFAPGRANIIGEHIDYHGGTVIPFAIDMGIHFFAKYSEDNTTRILSIDLDEEYIYDPNQPPSGWKRFFYDTVSQLQPPKAVQIGFGGNLPIGAGLSSSSALVCGIVQLFDIILGFSSTKEALLNKAIQIEKGNGLQGGTMDQTAIFFSKAQHAMAFNCSNGARKYIPIPKHWHFYLFNSGVKHHLVDSEYNTRSLESRIALRQLNHTLGMNYSFLVDVTMAELEKSQDNIDAISFKRAKYVIAEQNRVKQTERALQEGNIQLIGTLLNESHHDLRNLYEVSCSELDWLVEFAQNNLSIAGARMMGGGFGGCTINLTNSELTHDELQMLKISYFKIFHIHLEVYHVFASDGMVCYHKINDPS